MDRKIKKGGKSKMKDIQKAITKLIPDVIVESSDDEKIVFKSVTMHPFLVIKKLVKSDIVFGKIIYDIDNQVVEIYSGDSKELFSRHQGELSFMKI